MASGIPGLLCSPRVLKPTRPHTCLKPQDPLQSAQKPQHCVHACTHTPENPGTHSYIYICIYTYVCMLYIHVLRIYCFIYMYISIYVPTRVRKSWTPRAQTRAPKDHLNIRILQTMISGFPLVLGRGIRMWDPCVCVVFWALTKPPKVAKHSPLVRAARGRGCCRSCLWVLGQRHLKLQSVSQGPLRRTNKLAGSRKVLLQPHRRICLLNGTKGFKCLL